MLSRGCFRRISATLCIWHGSCNSLVNRFSAGELTEGSGETEMFKFDKSEIQRVAAAAVGALILTTTFVGAAVGPARAIETTPIAYAAAAGTFAASDARA